MSSAIFIATASSLEILRQSDSTQLCPNEVSHAKIECSSTQFNTKMDMPESVMDVHALRLIQHKEGQHSAIFWRSESGEYQREVKLAQCRGHHIIKSIQASWISNKDPLTARVSTDEIPRQHMDVICWMWFANYMHEKMKVVSLTEHNVTAKCSTQHLHSKSLEELSKIDCIIDRRELSEDKRMILFTVVFPPYTFSI